MRVTDHRYNGEMEKFRLALRMIRHEARTGTIRRCTGLSEDRIRKLYNTYFRGSGESVVRRRGKSPRQIDRFVSSTPRQSEASVLGGLLLICGAVAVDERGHASAGSRNGVTLGHRLCHAFESYREVHPRPRLAFEWAWSLYLALTRSRELQFSSCQDCGARYIQDRYALDYHTCPFCALSQLEAARIASGSFREP